MGAPAFAVPALRRLAAAYPLAVITQPDRPAGRGGVLTPPPVKAAALALGLEVRQPPTLRDPDAIAAIRAYAPAAIVVVAYGEILRPAVLDIPPHGCLNLHPSLLPRWRGPTPINAAILAGDATTGVTIVRMDRGMDSGPILAQEPAPVAPDDTAATLGARLAEQGARLLAETVGTVLAGEALAVPQPAEGVTICPLLHREDGRLDWTAPADRLARQVRAYDPWPGTFTLWGGRRIKVLAARAHPAVAGRAADDSPGRVRRLGDRLAGGGPAARRPLVCCGAGWLEWERVQIEGRPPLAGELFLQGYPALLGARLD